MVQLPETLETEHLFDAHITLADAEQIGVTPYGRRSTIIVTGGAVDGPRLRGTLRPGGGDWLLSFDAGHNELDVRATIETHDGAFIYLRYTGVLQVDPAVVRRIYGGEEIPPSAYYFRTTPRLECGDERYAWLNTTVCVGYGYFGPNSVGYRVFGVK